MAADDPEALRALAARLLEVLARYENALNSVAMPAPPAPGPDGAGAAAQPLRPLARAWVNFMASHTELLCPDTLGQAAREERLADLEAHFALLLELEARCLEITTGRRPPR